MRSRRPTRFLVLPACGRTRTCGAIAMAARPAVGAAHAQAQRRHAERKAHRSMCHAAGICAMFLQTPSPSPFGLQVQIGLMRSRRPTPLGGFVSAHAHTIALCHGTGRREADGLSRRRVQCSGNNHKRRGASLHAAIAHRRRCSEVTALKAAAFQMHGLEAWNDMSP